MMEHMSHALGRLHAWNVAQILPARQPFDVCVGVHILVCNEILKKKHGPKNEIRSGINMR